MFFKWEEHSLENMTLSTPSHGTHGFGEHDPFLFDNVTLERDVPPTVSLHCFLFSAVSLLLRRRADVNWPCPQTSTLVFLGRARL